MAESKWFYMACDHINAFRSRRVARQSSGDAFACSHQSSPQISARSARARNYYESLTRSDKSTNLSQPHELVPDIDVDQVGSWIHCTVYQSVISYES
ncbi:hypothetical protein EVAR_87607_1 [Eumeta japonica]|uniref:Uncharacterized protein n=1 Tax=Eumeta variegata TaxID=151549 RepID=A0A4C1WLR7_EUMVA|nr:hypothetical protein EVAR_87607_1 [Eumeta japonica]